MPNYGFTQREREALRRRKRVSNESALIVIILLGMIVLGFEFQTLVAKAQTISVIHDNAYYCSLIKNTGEGVVGASADEITKLCDKYK